MAFFGSLLGDFEDDPFTGHMRQMNRMMNSFFTASPFGSLMGATPDMMTPFDNRRHAGRNAMMPYGFPDMDRMFQGIDQTAANSHSFSSSTVLTMSNGPDGRPQVYQASQSVRSGPGGVRETKKSVADTRTGVKKLAIGHHIGERSHIMEREQNLHSGDREEREEFINLEEEEAPEFNREWQTKTRNYNAPHNAITYTHPSASLSRYPGGRHHHENTNMLPPAPSQSNVITEENYKSEAEEEDEDDEEGVKIVELEDDDDEEEEPVVDDTEKTAQQTTPQKDKSRKREHEPDPNYNIKVQKTNKDLGDKKYV